MRPSQPTKAGKEARIAKVKASTVVAMEYLLRVFHPESRLSHGNRRIGANIIAKTVTEAEIVCGRFVYPRSARTKGASAIPA